MVYKLNYVYVKKWFPYFSFEFSGVIRARRSTRPAFEQSPRELQAPQAIDLESLLFAIRSRMLRFAKILTNARCFVATERSLVVYYYIIYSRLITQ